MSRKIGFAVSVVLLAFVLSLVAQTGNTPPAGGAIAVIQPASSSTCKGVVRFTPAGTGVKMVADIEGLAAGAQHGFHIHEYGDCSAPDATSAGSHWDPEMTKHHGKPEENDRHSGDMGNLQADANGKAHLELTMEGLTIGGPRNSILGHAVIVHAKPDDFGQPVGNAGARIGCGVIGIAK
jgi:superoxide dismutase, Cu-Zn family